MTTLRSEHPATPLQKSLITAIGRQLKISTNQIDELQSALRRQR